MTKKRRTRRALVNSVISLIICFSMLLGTTFAWFTDSVVSSNNLIIAGNLDVELYHSDKDESNKKIANDVTDLLFDDVNLWEPGAVAYENFVVANEGSLALKYQMAVNFTNENHVGEYGLSDILKVAVIDSAINVDTADAAAREALVDSIPDTDWKTMSDFAVDGKLLPKESTLIAGLDDTIHTALLFTGNRPSRIITGMLTMVEKWTMLL